VTHYFRSWLNLLLVGFPASILLHQMGASPWMVFVAACVTIIPLAGLMGHATEDLAERAGTGIGGLLNATFGNAAELIIAIIAVRKGLTEIVKASLTGSIIGNLIFVLGLSLLAGGLRHKRQKFNATAAGAGVTMLSVAVMGMLLPAVYHWLKGPDLPASKLPSIETMSLIISAVLIANYVCGLVFSLKTHREFYNEGVGSADAADYVTAGSGESRGEPPTVHRPVWAAVTMLLLATVGVAIASELLIGSLEPVMHKLGFTPLFVGAIIIAVIGNAAEHSTAVLVAMRDKMDLAMQICIGSSLQVALFVTPVLVFLSLAMGKPMSLEFTAVEVIAVMASIYLVSTIANDGESNWFEGIQLISLYSVLAVAFYFI
jgi:Ca2+:H+ antiporter